MGFVFFPQFAWSGILVLKETAFWLNTKESLKNNWPLLDIILSISRVSDNFLTIVSPEKSANKASNLLQKKVTKVVFLQIFLP